MDVTEVLARLGGIAEWGELLGPCSADQIRHAVTTGRVVRLRRNRYALVDTDAQRAAAVAAGGVCSHLSAAMMWGWKVKHEPLRPWVTMPRNRRRPSGNLEVRWGDLDEEEVRHHVTRPARTVVDCARALPWDEALAVADSALRSGEVSRSDLVAAAERSPRTGRTRALRVVEAADGRAANPFESVLRAVALDVPGLDVEPQGEVPGVGWVDLLDRRRGVVVEAESFEFHGTLTALRRDVTRYTELTRRGFVVVRFLWEEAMFDQTRVRAVLADIAPLRQAVGS
ncbi:hypothetical protein [Nocardioides yefusunii]|uniref:DUF559 domain-containing protein n=1 Tax=Nocardioides yefusunii TaxID=2500546 RepID=A0ABW1QVB2_9ACTN|nr:hypothetical protein [Nocardioides yefusunii]